jgi:hypothetical protein
MTHFDVTLLSMLYTTRQRPNPSPSHACQQHCQQKAAGCWLSPPRVKCCVESVSPCASDPAVSWSLILFPRKSIVGTSKVAACAPGTSLATRCPCQAYVGRSWVVMQLVRPIRPAVRIWNNGGGIKYPGL